MHFNKNGSMSFFLPLPVLVDFLKNNLGDISTFHGTTGDHAVLEFLGSCLQWVSKAG